MDRVRRVERRPGARGSGDAASAEGGTLFLDEIGELPASLQAKLRRFLQERQFERLGETRTRKADVRVVAATNRDLEANVEGISARICSSA